MPDVVVVGSGVAGASVAFAAARRGAAVTVIDDRRTGRATSAGAGIIAPWATSLTGDVYDLYAAGPAAYPPLLEALHELGVDDVGYRRNGVLVLTPDAPEPTLERLTERTADSPVAGRPDVVDPATVHEMFPPLDPGVSGVHIPGGARVDGRRLAAGLLSGIRRLGGIVRDGTAALDADGAVGVDGDRIDAEITVIAAGVWVNDLLGTGTVPVAAQRGQICHLGLDVDTGYWPSVLSAGNHYIVPFDDGRVVVGATREYGVDEVRVTADGVSQVLRQALALAPGLADATLLESRVGLRPYPTVGDRPTIGRIGTDTWVISGFGAIGLTIGPTVGERVAESLLGGPDDHLLAPFDPGR